MAREDECGGEAVNEALVAQARAEMLPEGELTFLSTLFKLLGDPTRARIVLALDKRELCGCDLTALLGMTKSAISHQMAALRQCKIVKARRDGKHIYYSLDDQHVTEIIEMALAHMKHK